MRATLNIPDNLLVEVQKMTGTQSKTKAIVMAMEEFVKRKKRERLLALKGQIVLDDVTQELEAMELQEAQAHERR
ncbi:MAG: DUF2191 domain-containing protein [Candidatus Methylomirabilis oxygeniifera]|uniref:DUF2191 domain-containing protein n=1 Tax=Methylomirabilis oxygeniifera TaxID=671143 RepID=D5MJN6_METO1|nr:MAG: DUF2191 domain-containing protein [Candidatus Methylomirabilis oxyfera]CBE69621.1 protein of unknown function [Candidatus Methylomirabilis oxyfera]